MDVKIEYHLWKLRASRRISIRHLSEISGVSKTTINDIENGRHDPTIHTLCLLALALNVTPEDLYSYHFIP